MKKYLKFAAYVSLLMMALAFTSCQDEFENITTDDQETIDVNSATAKLITNTVSNDGSFDNIVDGASCFAIQFPYTVEVNGLEITINSVQDLRLIEEIFDALEDDVDLLEIIFPITITLADFTEIVINNKQDLRELAEDCIEGGGDDDIECIDFVYPITLFTFNAEEVETGSVTVNSDKELRRFLAGLDEGDLISIDFPVVMELYDGTEVRVSNNAELAAAIESAKDMCDEDDDDDFNDDDFTKERLDNYLVECPWLVREVKRNGENQTDQYFEYVMNFKENGEVTVRDREGNVLNGEWNTRVADHAVLLKLEFDVLVDFSLEWFVYEIDDNRIKLYAGDGDRIILKSLCNATTDDPDTLREILKECSWVIKNVKNQGEEIDRLLGYEFSFQPMGVVTLSNGENTSEGSWEITLNNQGRLVMAITMGNEPGVSFEWPLSDLRDKRLKFEVEETDYELVLIRNCNDQANDGDVAEIRNYMLGGDWVVTQYKEDGIEQTANYQGYSLAFSPMHRVTVSEGQDPFLDGLWRVLRDDEGKLKLYLNLDGNSLFEELTDDWDIVSVTNTRIELKDISGGDGSIDNLVFEKL